MSRIDEFSRLLGALEESVRGLTGKIDDNREAADRRHIENKSALQKIEGQMTTLGLDVMQDRALTAQLRSSAELDRARVDTKLTELEKEAAESKKFREWLAPKVVIAVAIVSGALWIVWTALTYFSAEVRGWVGRLFG